MPDKYSVKDIPATDSLIDSNLYMVEGKLLKAITFILKQLWRGENVNKGPNIYLRQFGDGGYSISSTAAPLVTSTPTAYTPFQIFANKHLVDGTWDNTYDITLYPGTVSQLLPTNIFSTINQGISSLQYVVLTCESDGYAVTSSTWAVSSDAPDAVDAIADAPPSTFYITIGAINYVAPVGDGAGSITIYQIVDTNLSAAPAVWTTVSRPDAGPYDYPQLNYYSWQITNG